MSKRSSASRFFLFVLSLIAIAGITGAAAQHNLLPHLLPKMALSGAHLLLHGKWGAALSGSVDGNRITQPIDNNVTVTLAGNTRPRQCNPQQRPRR